MSNVYGKIDIVAGTKVIRDVGGTGLSGIVIGNESGLTCKITLQGAGVTRTLYPGTADFFEVPQNKSWSGNLQIDPSSNLSNASSWPSSFVQVDTFGFNEKPKGVYPISFFRAGNVGNTVDTNTVSSGTTSVTNDGNPGATVFIEATQSGNASGSNVVDRNDGSFYRSQFISNVLTRLVELIVGVNPILKFGQGLSLHQVDSNGTDALFFHVNSNNYPDFVANASDVVQFSGNGDVPLFYLNGASQGNSMQLGPNIAVQGSTGPGPTISANILKVTNPGGITQLQAHSVGNQVQIIDKNGDVLSTIDANGCINMAGAITTFNGDTSGSMTIQEVFAGGSKWLIIKQNNYRQAAATPQQFTLVNTFTGPFAIMNLGCGGMEVLQATVKQTINVLSALALAGGSFTGQTNIQQASIGWCNTNINQIQSQGGYASAHTGVTILAGF
jgi:hypothetical protein